MAAIWFYADAHNQQQGPVEAKWLADAYRSGAVTAQTLVWREGLPGWVPLVQVAAQLGLIVVGGGAPPPPPRAAAGGPVAPGGHLVKPSGGSNTALIVIILIVGFIAVFGILAAIAIPAYSDYTTRAHVTEGAILADGVKLAVMEYSDQNGRCPHNGEGGILAAKDYGSKFVASITVGVDRGSERCAVEVAYANVSALDGKKLRFLLDTESKSWKVATDIPAKWLPMSMRNAMR